MNDYDSVALTLIPRSPLSHNSIKCVWGHPPSYVIYFSFLTPLVWQYIKRCLPCNTKIPIINLSIPHALTNDHILLYTFRKSYIKAMSHVRTKMAGFPLKKTEHTKRLFPEIGVSVKKVGRHIHLSPFTHSLSLSLSLRHSLYVCLFVCLSLSLSLSLSL